MSGRVWAGGRGGVETRVASAVDEDRGARDEARERRLSSWCGPTPLLLRRGREKGPALWSAGATCQRWDAGGGGAEEPSARCP